jgi:hypothetical protein
MRKKGKVERYVRRNKDDGMKFIERLSSMKAKGEIERVKFLPFICINLKGTL